MEKQTIIIAYLTGGGALFLTSMLLSFYRVGRVLRPYAYSFAYLTLSVVFSVSPIIYKDLDTGIFLGDLFLVLSVVLIYCGTISYFEITFSWPKRFWIYTVFSLASTFNYGVIQYNTYARGVFLVGITVILFIDFYKYLRTFFNEIPVVMKNAFRVSILFSLTFYVAKAILLMAFDSGIVTNTNFMMVFAFLVFMFNLILWFSTGIILEDSGQIHEMAEKNRQLKSMAERDPLTGLYNRNKLEQRLPNILAIAERLKTPISFIILDLDHFKTVNDRYGHAVGDRILIHLANILRRNVRESDMVFRWGGEEFLVLAIGAPMSGATVLAEHLRTMIESENFDIVGHITASFGIAETSYMGPKDNWFERVDAALYKAKETGRNRVVCWDETVQFQHCEALSDY